MNKDIIRISIINGPNLNLLGIRETAIYGVRSWDEIEKNILTRFHNSPIELLFYQSNHEGDIVNYIQKNINYVDGIVINPASLSANGYSILEALNSKPIPFIEVHMSNIYTRKEWHSNTIFAEYSVGQICGFGDFVYRLGILAIINYLNLK